MRYGYIVLFVFIASFFSAATLHAQSQQPLITATFDSATVETLVQQLQKQTGYTFYYTATDFDSTRFSFTATQQPLQQVMATAFANTDLYYAKDEDNHVFLTKGKMIVTSLPEDYFNAKAVNNNVIADNNPANAAKGKPGQKSVLENKLYEIGDKKNEAATDKVVLNGYLLDAKTGEPITGASIYIDKLKIGAATDQYGYYSITLPKGQHTLNIQGIGLKDAHRQVMMHGDGRLDIEVQAQVMTLKNVIMSAQKLNNIKSTQMGVQKIDIKAIKQVPVVFGEADILRVVLTLPGVKSVGEASTGLNVRGGAADQNLILFNDATVYNPSHFFGLFSAFNPEVVKDVELYKSSIPARFGGRLSSVLDINSREGNKKQLSGSAGIGLLTSRLNLEGPLVKDKSSFIIGARTTYAKWLLNILPDQYKNSRASFNDFNVNINHQFSKKSTLYVTGYYSNDKFNLNSDTFYNYGNRNFSVKLKQVFNNKLTGVFSVGYDRYQYGISSEQNPVNAYKLGFDINQSYFRSNFTYNLSTAHRIEAGLSTLYYKLHPGSYVPVGKSSLVVPDTIAAEKALESALYISDRYAINPDFSIDGGVRLSVFNYLGPQNINQYPAGVPRTEDNITGVKSYSNGAFIKTYGGPEYRLSARYAINDSFSLKAAYNTQRQYIHSISNITSMAPTDIWKLSDPNIKPQYGDQVSLGLYKNFKNNTIEASVEVYYKRMKDYLDYKSGAVLVMNHHLETDVMTTRGKAYGVEVLLKKSSGKLNGWISYTFSRTLLKSDDPIGEVINGGKYYAANYDKPHDITFIGNYRLNHRFSISLNATYSTGRPITLPIGSYFYGGAQRTLYADRNAYRIPDYFRSDFSMNIDGNHKVHQLTHNSWTIGVYNLTGRKNPYSVYFVSENGVVKGYKLSIFGSAIPYINFNIRF